MFWDTEIIETAPYERTWKSMDVLPEELYAENYVWALALGGTEITRTLQDLGIVNDTYMLFKNRMFNWKTGLVLKPKDGIYLIYDSKDGRKQKSADERVPFDTRDIDPATFDSLGKFPIDVKFTKVYK
jgi:hypothetical protein